MLARFARLNGAASFRSFVAGTSRWRGWVSSNNMRRQASLDTESTMKARASRSGWPGNLDVWLDDDPYCPVLRLRRPRKPQLSVPVLDENFKPLYEEILGEDEKLFIEDVLCEYVASAERSSEEKLTTVLQLQKLLSKVERMVRERIEIDRADAVDAAQIGPRERDT